MSKQKNTKKKKKRNLRIGYSIEYGLGLYNRTRKIIWQEFKENYNSWDYNSYNSPFLSDTKKVFSECNRLGATCSGRDIVQIYLEIRNNDKRQPPVFTPDLYTSVKPYYEIKNVEFDLFSPYLWVVSRMILDEPFEFQIVNYNKGTSNGYREYFSKWVNYCNRHYYTGKSDENMPHFIFSKPEWNTEKQRWETHLYSVNGTPEKNGKYKLNDWGYNRQLEEPTNEELAELELPTEEKEVKKDKQQTEEKEIINSKVKLNKQLKYESQINSYNSQKVQVREDIKLWKDLGDKDELKKAITNYKNLNDKIEKVNKLMEDLNT